MSKVYAGIGSRKLSTSEWDLCFRTGRWLAEQGWTLRTGACKGADRAFADGAISVEGHVVLCLPWPSYEFAWVSSNENGRNVTSELLQYWHKEAYASVDQYHPNPKDLRDAVKKLHARNYLIIAPAKFVIAWPKRDSYGRLGGTGQGIRIAVGLDIHTIRMDEPFDNRRVRHTIFT